MSLYLVIPVDKQSTDDMLLMINDAMLGICRSRHHTTEAHQPPKPHSGRTENGVAMSSSNAIEVDAHQ